MAQCLLGDRVVIAPGVALEGLPQIVPAVSAVHSEDLGNPATEAFDHAVGVRTTVRQRMLIDAQLCAKLLEDLLTEGLTGC